MERSPAPSANGPSRPRSVRRTHPEGVLFRNALAAVAEKLEDAAVAAQHQHVVARDVHPQKKDAVVGLCALLLETPVGGETKTSM